MPKPTMSEFWDARAAEDPFYFVDSRRRYGDPEDPSFWRGGRDVVDLVERLLELRIEPSERIVEIGCGIGRITRELAARAADVRAVDVSPRMLSLARRHNRQLDNVEWLLGDGRGLSPIATGSADGCCSIVVFQHIPEPAIALGYVAEIGRILRPGGWAAIEVSDEPAVHRPRRGPRTVLDRARAIAGRAPRGQGHPAWLGSPMDLDDLRRTAASAELATERVVGEGTQHCLVLMRRD